MSAVTQRRQLSMRHMAACLLMVLAASAQAGKSCNTQTPLKLQTITQSLNLAEKTRQALDSSGAKVVVLARAGQDLSKYGLKYSHLGFAYQQPVPEGGYVWRILHKLNACGTASSAIYRQGLGEFFMDDLWLYEAAWATPSPALQNSLLALLLDKPKSIQMHYKPYNMVSYAWGVDFQQSNQWAIETIALSMVPQMGQQQRIRPLRESAQKWLRQQDYQPTTLRINSVERLGGSLTSANLTFNDHPLSRRLSGQIDTVTVDSVFAWLQRSGLGAPALTWVRL